MSLTGLVLCVMLESSLLVCLLAICVIYDDNYSISSLRINLSIISPVLTFQQLFEEEGVPITAEAVTLDTNFKLKKNSMI